MEKLNMSANAPQFSNNEDADKFLEAIRWADGVLCPHCGSVDKSKYLAPRNGGRKTRTGSVSVRRLWQCDVCHKQFSVLVNTIFEDSRIDLWKWVRAVNEMCSGKNGVSAMELKRKLKLTYKTAWFMAHRIRCGIVRSPAAPKLTGTIEVDESYLGGRTRNMHKSKRVLLRKQRVGLQGGKGKTPIVTVVERGGEARSQVMRDVNSQTILEPIVKNVDAQATLNTDTSRIYSETKKSFATQQVDHLKGEYVRGGKDGAHINTVEGFFGLLKPSIRGTYRHVSPKHLQRYLAEFDYRYSSRHSDDAERTVKAIEQTKGKRLTYRGLIQK